MKRKYKIHFSAIAANDLKELVNYIRIELKEPQTAKKWYKRIKDEINTLDDMPTRINHVKDEALAKNGFRLLVVGNYLIFFIIDEKERQVNIARILHGRRDWIRILK